MRGELRTDRSHAAHVSAEGLEEVRTEPHAGPNVIANAEFAETVTVRDVGRAHAEQTALVRRFNGFMDDFDVLICPSASVVPFPVEAELSPRTKGWL